MGVFTVRTGVTGNQKPVVGNYSLFLKNREDKILSGAMFTTGTSPAFSDLENDIPHTVKIVSLSNAGTLQLAGVAVIAGQEIPLVDINAGNLVWVAPLIDTITSTSFTFNVSNGQYSDTDGTFGVTNSRLIVVVNLAPTIGDNAKTITSGAVYTFALTDFTSGTSPAYYDPEGDVASFIHIKTLPSSGTLQLNGVPVVTGEKIGVASIPLLTYVSDVNNISLHNTSFDFTVEDTGSLTQSNPGTFGFTIEEKINSSPTVGDVIANMDSNTYTFSTASFTTNFADADGDSYESVYIASIPMSGRLSLLGGPVTVGTNFLAVNASGLKFHLDSQFVVDNFILYEFSKGVPLIVADYDALGYKLTGNLDGLLTFTNSLDSTDIIKIQGEGRSFSRLTFIFQTTDDSIYKHKSHMANHSLGTNVAEINKVAVYQNSPPIVGDNTITVGYNEIRILTQAYFIEDTDPRFFDAEGDTPYQLKVLSLPLYGQLLLNNTAVIIDQIISFTDINANNFKYVADNSRIDIENTKFNFAVSDSGSKIFIS